MSNSTSSGAIGCIVFIGALGIGLAFLILVVGFALSVVERF